MQYKWISRVSVDRTIVAPSKSVISVRVRRSDGFGKLKYLCVYLISKAYSPDRLLYVGIR